jgi:hypothetical protein
MKLGVLSTVYNEAMFLDLSIQSYYPHVDNVFLLEGAYQETIRLGKPDRSDDRHNGYLR